MPCESKSINLWSFTWNLRKYFAFYDNEELSYPILFLKIYGSDIYIISNIYFLDKRTKKSTQLRDEMFFIHYLLKTMQYLYSISSFRAPVATQVIVKV